MLVFIDAFIGLGIMSATVFTRQYMFFKKEKLLNLDDILEDDIKDAKLIT
jgi:hypothetical protein